MLTCEVLRCLAGRALPDTAPVHGAGYVVVPDSRAPARVSAAVGTGLFIRKDESTLPHG
jgi:hypothetical protein